MKTNNDFSNSLPVSETIPCFDCEAGKMKPEIIKYELDHPRLGECLVPGVELLICDQCGSKVMGDAASEKIDAWLDDKLKVIPPGEIRRFLTKYQLTQREASEITGLGEKNISRWMNGRSRPSETVSNLLRLLLSDESAFERLRTRNFGDEISLPSFPTEERQPDSEEKEILKLVDYKKLADFGFVENCRSPKEKRTHICRLSKCSDLNEFRKRMSGLEEKMAAFKDTGQNANPVSSGLWIYLGERAAERVETEPFHRDKLRVVVKQLRELTQHPLEDVAETVQSILAKAGVALVFIPIMKEAALRGCTRLLTPDKAMIIHGLKFRNVSQFWIILFHEIAHLLLHISKPGETFADYERQSDDVKEKDADTWAYDTLVSLDRELEFKSQIPVPKPWQVNQFAQNMRVHPAIVAEIFNKRAGKEIISYSHLKKEGLFPHFSKAAADALIATSALSI